MHTLARRPLRTHARAGTYNMYNHEREMLPIPAINSLQQTIIETFPDCIGKVGTRLWRSDVVIEDYAVIMRAKLCQVLRIETAVNWLLFGQEASILIPQSCYVAKESGIVTCYVRRAGGD